MAKTQAQYEAECRAANPQPQFRTVNGEKLQLTDDEHEAAVVAWAAMRVAQDEHEAEDA